MKNKPPRNDRPSATDRLVGANRLFERDVLLDEPRREPRVRSSIIGDRKLTARDAGEKKSGEKSFKEKIFKNKVFRDKPLGEKKPDNKAQEKKVQEKKAPEKSGASEARSGRLLGRGKPSVVAAGSPMENRSRVVFDDPLLTRADSNLRREKGYSKVSPQGGKTKGEKEKKSAKSQMTAVEEVRARLSRKYIYRGLGLLVLLSAFATIAWFATDPLTHLLERPLKSVAVEGQFQYLPKDRAMELIEKEIDGDFLQLNLERLKNVLQADPWVEHVYLSRRWPDTLVVKIAEQKPIARWDANGFLNQRGEIIRVKETDKLSGLPWLQGNEINTREILQQYQDLATLLRSRGLEIVALKCDNKKSWRLTLKNDVEIAIGREQVMEKLRRFVTVYDKFLSGVWGDVKAIDVRYSNGVAVRWVTDSEMAKKYLKPSTTATQK